MGKGRETLWGGRDRGKGVGIGENGGEEGLLREGVGEGGGGVVRERRARRGSRVAVAIRGTWGAGEGRAKRCQRGRAREGDEGGG